MDHAEKLALLRRTRLLETLPEEQLNRLLGSCREVSLVPGEALCHEGEVGRAMYVVLSGNLVVSKGGKQVAVGRPGDCFGEMALIESRERSATLRALDDTLMIEIPEAAFVEHLSTVPGPLLALLRVFSDRARHDLESLVSANLKLQAQAEEMDRKNRELTETRRQLEQRNRDLERLSALDTLTQIANRRRFDAVLRQEWRRAVRDEAPISLLFCDIDYFKRFNDTYGHQAGDECLVRVAQAMEETLNRPADLVARYGGEEFIALLVDTDPEGGRMLAERMRARIEELKIENRDSSVGPFLTVSLGVATLRPEPDAAARGPDGPRRPRALRGEGERTQPRVHLAGAAGGPGRDAAARALSARAALRSQEDLDPGARPQARDERRLDLVGLLAAHRLPRPRPAPRRTTAARQRPAGRSLRVRVERRARLLPRTRDSSRTPGRGARRPCAGRAAPP